MSTQTHKHNRSNTSAGNSLERFGPNLCDTNNKNNSVRHYPRSWSLKINGICQTSSKYSTFKKVFECQVTGKAHEMSVSVFCNTGWEMNHGWLEIMGYVHQAWCRILCYLYTMRRNRATHEVMLRLNLNLFNIFTVLHTVRNNHHSTGFFMSNNQAMSQNKMVWFLNESCKKTNKHGSKFKSFWGLCQAKKKNVMGIFIISTKWSYWQMNRKWQNCWLQL